MGTSCATPPSEQMNGRETPAKCKCTPISILGLSGIRVCACVFERVQLFQHVSSERYVSHAGGGGGLIDELTTPRCYPKKKVEQRSKSEAGTQPDTGQPVPYLLLCQLANRTNRDDIFSIWARAQKTACATVRGVRPCSFAPSPPDTDTQGPGHLLAKSHNYTTRDTKTK